MRGETYEKRTKKVIACALIFAMVLSMAACGNGDEGGETSTHTDGQVVVNIDWLAYIDPGQPIRMLTSWLS